MTAKQTNANSTVLFMRKNQQNKRLNACAAISILHEAVPGLFKVKCYNEGLYQRGGSPM